MPLLSVNSPINDQPAMVTAAEDISSITQI